MPKIKIVCLCRFLKYSLLNRCCSHRSEGSKGSDNSLRQLTDFSLCPDRPVCFWQEKMTDYFKLSKKDSTNRFFPIFYNCFINSWHKWMLAVTWKLAYLYHSCHLLKKDQCLVICTVPDKQLELKLSITCLKLLVTKRSYGIFADLIHCWQNNWHFNTPSINLGERRYQKLQTKLAGVSSDFIIYFQILSPKFWWCSSGISTTHRHNLPTFLCISMKCSFLPVLS